jgi:hypothetical protein
VNLLLLISYLVAQRTVTDHLRLIFEIPGVCDLRLSHSMDVPVPVAVRSAAARLLRWWFRIPPGTWTFVVSVR